MPIFSYKNHGTGKKTVGILSGKSEVHGIMCRAGMGRKPDIELLSSS